ncbi:protein of unknown function (plasmid) [Agrobacterium pusense]|uniref:Uncharacterized protein n=1 Tax=Agrobacterium pusense TaxID=648995 RepID=U4Q5A1_9HYPH|nr:protein of unknown function [Agrobacterium pusense]
MLAITPVALARFRIMLRIVARVGGERSRDVDAFLELAVLIAAHITLVGPGINQFTLAHDRPPLLGFVTGNVRRRKKMHPNQASSADSHNEW